MFLAKGINVSCRTINGQAYILLEDKNEFFCLNESGSKIWEMINGLVTEQDVIDMMMNEYEASFEEIANSVNDFISELASQGMIVSSDRSFQGVMASA